MCVGIKSPDMGIGSYPRTSSSSKTSNNDMGLHNNGPWKEFGHEELKILSEEKYLLG